MHYDPNTYGVSDDYGTYGSVPVVTTYHGCAGERCPDGTCEACTRQTVSVATEYHPIAR